MTDPDVEVRQGDERNGRSGAIAGRGKRTLPGALQIVSQWRQTRLDRLPNIMATDPTSSGALAMIVVNRHA